MSQFIGTLTLQGFIGIIFLAGVLIVISIVVFLIVNSAQNEDKEPVKHKVYKIRGRHIFELSLLFIIISFVSLQFLPYSRFQGEADEVVTVLGIQWDWQMAHGITNKTPHQFLGKNEISLPVNKRIKFIVMSDDVTHNFGIYNSKGILLTMVSFPTISLIPTPASAAIFSTTLYASGCTPLSSKGLSPPFIRKNPAHCS